MQLALALFLHPLTLVAAGSAAGGVARYAAGLWVAAQPWAGGLPWGTFLINVAGSFVLGLVAAVCHNFVDSPADRHLYLLVGTGVCGGFTTFSTFELEAHRLLAEGRVAVALGYAAGSVGCGLAGVALGVWLGRHMVER